MLFTHTDDEVQLAWGERRQALAEYMNLHTSTGRRWVFMGWLWDGEIRSMAEAEARTREYLAASGAVS